MNSTDLTKHLPEGMTWMRAVVSSVPVVGSALDHLLFDKADIIRLRNIEQALAGLADQLKSVSDTTIDKKWFETEEALAAFRAMANAVAYEPDKQKIDALGRIVALCGSIEHSADDKKLSVLDHLSRLSAVQIKLLSAIQRTPPEQRQGGGGAVAQTVTAVWLDQIVETLKAGPRFWTGTIQVVEELELIESVNLIRRVATFGKKGTGYALTSTGKRAASYVQSF